MRRISLAISKLRRPQYRLSTLFALVAILSVSLALWAERERRYRVRLGAANLLVRYDCLLSLRPPDGDPLHSLDLGQDQEALRRNDVVDYIDASGDNNEGIAGIRADKLAAILCFPAITFLDVSSTNLSDAQL